MKDPVAKACALGMVMGCAWSSILISVVAMLGLMFDVPNAASWGMTQAMAAPTAFAMILLGTGVLGLAHHIIKHP